MLKIKYVLIILLLTSLSCKAQLTVNPNNDYTLIQGNWIPEESPNIKLSFEGSSLKVYYNNILDKTYDWVIINDTNSGVKSKYLETVNTLNSNDKKNYEISALTENTLVLIYQRKNNFGISKPITYTKQ